jgi:iron complex outermembrane receptor protein
VRGKFDKKLDGNKTGSDNLTLIPAPKWTSEIRGDFMKLGKNVKSFYAKIETEIYFRQNKPFTGFNTETATPGYTLINAGIGGDVVKNKKTLFSLYFGVANITDKAYQNHLSRLKYTAENLATGRTGVFNVGRNFSVKLNIPIQISK